MAVLYSFFFELFEGIRVSTYIATCIVAYLFLLHVHDLILAVRFFSPHGIESHRTAVETLAASRPIPAHASPRQSPHAPLSFNPLLPWPPPPPPTSFSSTACHGSSAPSPLLLHVRSTVSQLQARPRRRRRR